MSLLSSVITSDKGFFYYLNETDSTKYQEIFGEYTNSLDLFFFYNYGNRSCSPLTASNTLTNVALILWIKYYARWSALVTTVNATLDTDSSEKYTTDEQYTSNGNNNLTRVNALYGFDSDTPKDNTRDNEDATNAQNYTREITRNNANIADVIKNKSSYLNLKSINIVDEIFKDIVETVALPLYNIDD